MLPHLKVIDLNHLEKALLKGLEFNVSLSRSLYAKYYFELKSLSDPKKFPIRPMDAKAAQRLEVCFRSCICDHFQECVFNATTLTMSRIAPVNVKRKPKMSYERGVLLPSRCFQFENHFQKITLRLLDELFSIEAIDRICRRDHCECLFNPICFSSTIINSIISVGVLLDCLSDREDVKPSPQIRKNIRNCSVIMLLQAFSCVSVILHRID